ncbi:hypothetical protein BRADI_5g09958v3 [Brachypodium distachyon]|uniref:Phytocyanin domain-containing protein n=1 Tax=Brachypodium distachyon TaxID=15368 RepID=A0A0Q3E4H7_BRADI|nr:hypothetical protein BRADI_5g09958v3 [Brachypodium distachyon]
MARGSSSKVGLGLLLAFVMLELAMAQPRVWPVGDSKGWSLGVIGWPNYKPFKAGDLLATTPRCTTSGDDRITLSRGMTFFICGKPGHCERGMKIAVTAR